MPGDAAAPGCLRAEAAAARGAAPGAVEHGFLNLRLGKHGSASLHIDDELFLRIGYLAKLCSQFYIDGTNK